MEHSQAARMMLWAEGGGEALLGRTGEDIHKQQEEYAMVEYGLSMLADEKMARSEVTGKVTTSSSA